MKGISPLVASVLLISFTVAVSMLFSGWVSSFAKTTTQNVSFQALSSLSCSSGYIEISDVFLSGGPNCSVLVLNEGGTDLQAQVSFVTLSGSMITSGIYNITKGGSANVNLPNCSLDCSSFSKAIVTTNCNGVTASLSDYSKSSYKGTQCTICKNLNNGASLITTMDANSSIAADSSGYGNDCSIYGGAVWNASGKFGGSYNFNGIDAYMDCGNSSSLALSGPLTVEAWFNPSGGWNYMRTISISNSVSALTDYPVQIRINYSSKMRPNYSDLRFTSSNGSLLNYWVENYTASNATVWVKVPSLPSGNTIIEMYYGNAYANSTSNGSNVFPYFESFETVSGWNLTHYGCGGCIGSSCNRSTTYVTDGIYGYRINLAGSSDPCYLDPSQSVELNKSVDFTNVKKLVVDLYTNKSRPWTNSVPASILIGSTQVWTTDSDAEYRGTVINTGSYSGVYQLRFNLTTSSNALDHGKSLYIDTIRGYNNASVEPVASIGTEEVSTVSVAGSYGIAANVSLNMGGVNNQTVNASGSQGWRHVAMTYNGLVQNLYVNGTLVSSQPLSGAVSVNYRKLLIGRFYNGSIDQVKIYSRALSDNEIQTEYYGSCS